MASAAPENGLAERQYATLILRLTLDRDGRLVRGELVDITDTLQERFVSLVGLNQALQHWLRRQVRAEDDA